MVARRGKCPQDWNSENLIFWCTLRDMLSLLSDTHHAGPTLDGGNWGLDCTDDYKLVKPCKDPVNSHEMILSGFEAIP